MARARRNAALRYRVGGFATTPLLLLDMEPGAQIPTRDWPGVRDAIDGQSEVKWLDLQRGGSVLVVELMSSAEANAADTLVALARRLAQTAGINIVGTPRPATSRRP